MNEEEWIEHGGGRPGAISAADLAKFENLWDRRTTVLRFLTEPIVVKLDPSHPEYSRARQVVVTGPNDIVRVKELGKGAQGVVYLAQHKFTKLPIAVKVQTVRNAHDKEQLRAEFRLLSLLKHENIVTFYGAFYSEDEKLLTLLLEYMDFGCLSSAMSKLGKPNLPSDDQKTTLVQRPKGVETVLFLVSCPSLGALPEDVLSTVARHCLLGLEYLHSKEVVHRDIKPMNILLSKHRNVTTLTDFGMSLKKKPFSKEDPELGGTIEYMAPERLMDETYSYPSDIWSMGVVVSEAALGSHPVPNRSLYWDMCENRSIRGCCLEMLRAHKVSSELLEFAETCLESEVSKRPTASQLLQHGFMKKHEDPKASALRDWLLQLDVNLR